MRSKTGVKNFCAQDQKCKNRLTNQLSKDMKIKIFSQLSLSDLFRICLTTKVFNSICQREDFWFVKLQNDYPYIKPQHDSYKQTYQHIKHLEHSLQMVLKKKHTSLILTPNALKCLILILSYLGQNESMESLLIGEVHTISMGIKSDALAGGNTYWLMFDQNDIKILTSKPIHSRHDFLEKAPILSYVASEILELAGNVSLGWNKSTVDINQIRLSIEHDSELRSMFKDVDCLNKFVLDKDDLYISTYESSSLSDDYDNTDESTDD